MSQQPVDTASSDGTFDILCRASTLPSLSPFSGIKRGTKTLSFKQVVKLAQKLPIESQVEQQLVSSLPSDVQIQLRASGNAHDSLIQVIKNGQVNQPNEQSAACLRELNDKMVENNELASRIMDLVYKNNEFGSRIMDLTSDNNELAYENTGLMARMTKLQEAFDAKQDEMKNLQIQALDRLALLQNSVAALLTQTYELHEYPIPRLSLSFQRIARPGSRWIFSPTNFAFTFCVSVANTQDQSTAESRTISTLLNMKDTTLRVQTNSFSNMAPIYLRRTLLLQQRSDGSNCKWL